MYLFRMLLEFNFLRPGSPERLEMVSIYGEQKTPAFFAWFANGIHVVATHANSVFDIVCRCPAALWHAVPTFGTRQIVFNSLKSSQPTQGHCSIGSRRKQWIKAHRNGWSDWSSPADKQLSKQFRNVDNCEVKWLAWMRKISERFTKRLRQAARSVGPLVDGLPVSDVRQNLNWRNDSAAAAASEIVFAQRN